MKFSDIIMDTISRGMEKYKSSSEANTWDAETKFVLGYVDLSGAKPGDSIGFPIHLVELSAEEGFMLAQYIIGNCYHDGYGVNRDTNKAVYWWQKAAAQGLVDAKEKLGV